MGRSDQGLLGQGGKIRESKAFKQVQMPDGVYFDKISIMYDHALAIDCDGKLWAWGSNLQHRAGLEAEIMQGVFQPVQVPFAADMRPVEVSAGLDHSLVLAEELSQSTVKRSRLYSLGKEEANFRHLGCSKEQASEGVMREITSLSDFKVLSFCAATKYNLIIV